MPHGLNGAGRSRTLVVRLDKLGDYETGLLQLIFYPHLVTPAGVEPQKQISLCSIATGPACDYCGRLMVISGGVEPPASSSASWRSIQLSYETKIISLPQLSSVSLSCSESFSFLLQDLRSIQLSYGARIYLFFYY